MLSHVQVATIPKTIKVWMSDWWLYLSLVKVPHHNGPEAAPASAQSRASPAVWRHAAHPISKG